MSTTEPSDRKPQAQILVSLEKEPRLAAIVERLKAYLGLPQGMAVIRFVLVEAARARGLSVEIEDEPPAVAETKKSSTEAA